MRPLWVGLLLLHAATVAAQGEEEAYQRGVEALETGDTEGAVEAFREAFTADPTPRHALALAATHQQRGEFAAAVRLYDRLLAGETGELSDRQTTAVQEAREAATLRVVTLEVSASDERPMTLEVDGMASGRVSADAPVSLRLDPGQHRIRGLGDDGSVSETLLVDMGEGDRRDVALTLGQPPAPAESDEPVEGATVTAPSRPVAPWILLGSAALPLGLGIAGLALRGARLDDADAAASQVEAAPLIDDARRFGRMATVGFVLSGGLIVAGVVWAILAGRGGDERSARIRMGRLEVAF